MPKEYTQLENLVYNKMLEMKRLSGNRVNLIKARKQARKEALEDMSSDFMATRNM